MKFNSQKVIEVETPKQNNSQKKINQNETQEHNDLQTIEKIKEQNSP